jgi:asparagine N-glycosylation enzyme membrane subunit Stt3
MSFCIGFLKKTIETAILFASFLSGALEVIFSYYACRMIKCIIFYKHFEGPNPYTL